MILVLIMLTGAGIIAYPSFSDWWNSYHQTRAIAGYVETVAQMDPETFERILREAEAYNTALLRKSNRYSLSEEEKKIYNSTLNIMGNGIMGYIDIPKIDVSLPVYHGTDEAVLQIAIGHIEGTSLPIGGIGNHSALSGHRGLPSAKLFSNIDQLKEGDHFLLQVMDRTLTYEVDQIKTVLPSEMQDLDFDKEKDLCTLITCTPYGVNTHRLLVRGHRVQTKDNEAHVVAEAMRLEPVLVAPLMASPILLLLLLMLLFSTRGNKKKKKKKRHRKKNRKKKKSSGAAKTAVPDSTGNTTETDSNEKTAGTADVEKT